MNIQKLICRILAFGLALLLLGGCLTAAFAEETEAPTTEPPTETQAPTNDTIGSSEETGEPAPTIIPDGNETTPTPGAPTVTKDPTGETVVEGETALFVARADNADKIVWYLVNRDSSVWLDESDYQTRFPGLRASGWSTDTLKLEKIPLELDGWFARAEFIGKGGTTLSKPAEIIVEEKTVRTPNISRQPKNLDINDMSFDKSLSVSAEAPDGGSLSYQWYCCESGKMGDMRPITGATSRTYTPELIAGTMYYCVGVRNTKYDLRTDELMSDIVSVKYTPSQTEPTAAPTGEATQPATEETEAPATEESTEFTFPPTEPEEEEPTGKKGSGLLTVLWIITGLLAVATAAVAYFLFLYKPKGGKYSS